MSEKLNTSLISMVKTQAEANQLISKLFDVAQASAVFSKPVTTEDCLVINAAEISVGMGIGYGIGGSETPVESADETEAADQEEEAAGIGGGGGGGGGASGRPVAVISISADGVRVEPIVDVTKISLALFTTLGSMFIMLGKIFGKKK